LSFCFARGEKRTRARKKMRNDERETNSPKREEESKKTTTTRKEKRTNGPNVLRPYSDTFLKNG
jgi:hypothetical protein